MNLLKSKPEKAINDLTKHLTTLEAGDTNDDGGKLSTKLATDIQLIHKMLYGDSGIEPNKKDIEFIVPALLNSENDLFKKLAENLKLYQFETRKKTAEIMNYIVRRTGKEHNNFASYLADNHSIVINLLKGYHDPNLSQNVGSVLQEMCKRSELAKLLLNEIKVTIHKYNDWDIIVSANANEANGNDNPNENNTSDKPQPDANADKGNVDQDANSPAMPDWNREQTAPESSDAAQQQQQDANATDANDTTDANATTAADASAADNTANGDASAAANGNGNGDEKAADEKDDNGNDKTENDMVDELFILVQNPSFDIASDAYKTLQLLLTRHKKEVSKYLEVNYTNFFTKFNYLIMSENYVTKRQFLKLLSELLLDKHNFKTMLKYISEKDNLINAMKLIKNPSKAIAFEAFHIFKVFVANPNKSRDVHIVLYKNQTKLVKFLTDFLKDKEDQAFISEKEIVIQHLQNMEMPEEIKKKLEERKKLEQEQEAANANGDANGDTNNDNANETNDSGDKPETASNNDNSDANDANNDG